ncbi:recombination protein NinG [Propionivibrio sp.]|uniref:recombination protein NinG n=1 Tax=Propionivibrio sp. TaxID=2212460 RepID=UPI003BEF79BC
MSLAAADSLMGIFGMKRVVVPKKAKRPKLTPLPTLIRKADTVTSEFIRRKHADEHGNVTCVSCGKVLHWKMAHCAHFIGRGKKSTRWLEENLKPACCGCNTFNKEYHMREYTLFMVDFYGKKFVDELRDMEKQVLSASQVRTLAEEAIDDYTAKTKELRNAA